MAIPPKQQIVIDALIKEIDNDKSWSDILAINGKKWLLSKRTIQRRWKEANRQYLERAGLIYSKVTDKTIDKEIDIATARLNMIAEVDADLFKLFKGKLLITQKKPVILDKLIELVPVENPATIGETIEAAKTIYKRFGSNAPTKTDITTKGEAINHIPIHSWAKDDTEQPDI